MESLEDTRNNLFIRRENEHFQKIKPTLPVVLVTGPLGAGKTTFLKNIIARRENLNIAFAVNDITGHVDSSLIQKLATSEVIDINNGCSCCSLASELKNKIYLLHQDMIKECKVQYLVVETSGVSNPRSIIQMLEENFGKMYYVRLDCVVTVVDSDLLFDSISRGQKFENTQRDQLHYADVIILNKIDLLTKENLVTLRKKLLDDFPNSIVHECEYANIALPLIFDITNDTATLQAVSHEQVKNHYTVSTTGKNKRQVKQPHSCSDPHHDHDHVHREGLDSFSFEHQLPFSLFRFQEFLHSIPDGIVRIKGTMFFSSFRRNCYQFHLSGRQRYEIVDTGRWQEAPFIHLAFIGKNIDKTALMNQLNAIVVTNEEAVSALADPPVETEFEAMLKSDKRFEYKCTVENVVSFRLTGYLAYGLSLEKSKLHGINFNQINSTFLKSFNSNAGRWFLTYATIDNEVWLQFDQSKSQFATIEAFTEVLKSVSDETLEKYYKNICGCARMW